MKGLKFYKYIQDRNDADYLRTLSPEDRAWYEQFLQEYYGCDSRKFGDKATLNREQHLDALKANTRASKDLMSYKTRKYCEFGTLEESGDLQRGQELLEGALDKRKQGRPKKVRIQGPKKVLIKKKNATMRSCSSGMLK